MHGLSDLQPALPEIVLALSGILLLLIGAFSGDRGTRTVSWLAVLAFIATAALIITRLPGATVALNGLFITDDFAVYAKLLILLGSAVTLIMSQGFIERENMARPEYPVLFVFATVGMMMMVSANDLISLYIGLELQSLSLYVIAAFHRDSARSSEAGLKYFVLGALSSGMLLYGASLVYGFAGATNFDVLATVLGGEGPPPFGVVVGIVFVAAGLAFKTAAVPFHMWTPDVYEGSPTPVTAFFSAAPKMAAMALFVRVMAGPFEPLLHQWQQIIIAISILSMVLGSFAAINQTNIKRLMAYSSIGHVGYALMGLAAGTQLGVRSVLIYMAIYIVMNLGTFACILSMRVNGRMVERVEDLAGLSRTHPLMAFAVSLFMFSMAGVPPLAGFFSKLYVFIAAVRAEQYGLAVIGVLASVVGAYYYLRIVKLMYFDDPVQPIDRPIGAVMGTVLAVSGAFILFFCLLPTPLVEAAQRAAGALIGS